MFHARLMDGSSALIGTNDAPKKRVQGLERMRRLLELYSALAPNAKSIRRDEVETTQKWLAERLHAGNANGGLEVLSTNEAIRRYTVTKPEDLELLKRYQPHIGMIPTEGRLASPVICIVKNVSTLVPGKWLDEVVMEAYGALT